MKHRNKPLMLIGVVAVGLILVFGSAGMRGSAAGNPQAPLSTGEPEQVVKLREVLDGSALSPDVERSVREKLEMAERLEAQRENGGAQPRSTKVPVPEMEAALAQAVEAIEIPDAIFEGSEGLVRPWEATVVNGFEGQRDGKIVQALAGAHPEDPSQGLLYVIEQEVGRLGRTTQVYSPGEAAGALRITSVEGSRLLLSSESGAALSFDLGSRSFGE